MVMKPEELAKLKNKSSYDDGMNEWSIPVFLLKARKLHCHRSLLRSRQLNLWTLRRTNESLFTRMIYKTNIRILLCLKTITTTDLLHNMKQLIKEDRLMNLMHSNQDLELK